MIYVTFFVMNYIKLPVINVMYLLGGLHHNFFGNLRLLPIDIWNQIWMFLCCLLNPSRSFLPVLLDDFKCAFCFQSRVNKISNLNVLKEGIVKVNKYDNPMIMFHKIYFSIKCYYYINVAYKYCCRDLFY